MHAKKYYFSTMPIKREIPNLFGHYFITFTCVSWLPLFEKTKSYDLVYKWFDYLKEKGHIITGYVIMPNHLHATIAFKNVAKRINKIVGDGKRFIGYEIINRLKEKNENEILEALQLKVKKSDLDNGKIHEIWEDSFDWKDCYDDKITLQKLNYMHQNPCVGKWKLASSPIEYPHSSALFYLSDNQGIYQVTSYLALRDISLSE
jgi:REP element-mobilizing transposase RayT